MVSNKIISVAGVSLPSDIAYGRIAEMHRRICHALHDVHIAARMQRAFLNIDNNATVRQAAKKYGISKSTEHVNAKHRTKYRQADVGN